jgi:hypothetical protein
VKYIITVVLTALIVGFGVVAYFKGWFPSVQNTKVSNVSPEVLPNLPTDTLAPVEVDDNQTILTAVKTAMIAKHGSDFSNLNYSINKVEGNYASGDVGGQGGGGMWYAAKVSGVWVIVWDGNGTISCSDLASYQKFPNDMIPECWDASANKNVTR